VLEVRPSMAAQGYAEEYLSYSQSEYDEEEQDSPSEAGTADKAFGTAALTITPQDHIFPSARVGYGEQAAQTFTIANTGDVRLRIHSMVPLKGVFTWEEISGFSADSSIQPGETLVLQMRPPTGLDVGTHQDKVQINVVHAASYEESDEYGYVDYLVWLADNPDEWDSLYSIRTSFTLSFTVTDDEEVSDFYSAQYPNEYDDERHYPGGILELPTTPHVRPVPQLMGWSTNGDFSIFEGPPWEGLVEPNIAGVVTNSTLTWWDFVAARELVIEFNHNVSLDGVSVTNVHSPGIVLDEFRRGINLNYFLWQDGNRMVFDLTFVTAEHHNFYEVPYCIYFIGIENFNIARVYLVF